MVRNLFIYEYDKILIEYNTKRKSIILGWFKKKRKKTNSSFLNTCWIHQKSEIIEEVVYIIGQVWPTQKLPCNKYMNWCIHYTT